MDPLAAANEQLERASRDLSICWQSTHEVWNDAAREEFATIYWAEFEQTTANAIERLQHIIHVLDQAERDLP